MYITVTVYLQCVLLLLVNVRRHHDAVNVPLAVLLPVVSVVVAAVVVVAAAVPSKAVDEVKPFLLRIN